MSVTARTDEESSYRLLHAGAFLALFCVGLYASAFGPAMPFIASGLGVSLDTAGLVLTVFFIGSITASAAVAVALHARSSRLLGSVGLSAVAAGCLVLGFADSWPIALAGGVLMGAGDGLVIAGLHILMARSSRDVPSAVNNLNLFFAFGAILGPLWAGGVLDSSGNRGFVYAGIAAAALAAMLVLLTAHEPGSRSGRSQPGDDLEEALQGSQVAIEERFALPRDPVTLVMGAVLFLYVGAEFGLGAWVASYARETTGAGIFAAAALTAGFWLALAIGRLLTGVYFGRQRDALSLLTVAAAGGAVACLVLAVATGHLLVAGAAAFGAGLCMGPMWPATVAIVSARRPSSDTAAIVTMGNAGGVAIPWLQGKVLVGAGAAQGVAVTAALCAVMFGITSVLLLRRDR